MLNKDELRKEFYNYFGINIECIDNHANTLRLYCEFLEKKIINMKQINEKL